MVLQTAETILTTQRVLAGMELPLFLSDWKVESEKEDKAGKLGGQSSSLKLYISGITGLS